MSGLPTLRGPLTLRPGAVRPLATEAAKPQPKSERTRKWSKGAGKVLQALGKVPKFYRYVPGLLRFAVVEGVVTGLQITAGLTGVAAVVGMGLAGALEIADGARERDPLKVLSGSGELTRGLALGAVTAHEYANLGAHAGTVWGVGQGLVAVQGALTLTSGVLKIRQGLRTNDLRPRVEGLLELGVATATFAAAGGLAPGPMLGLAVGLNTVRFAYTRQDTLKAAGQAIARRGHQLWDRLVDVFRDDDVKPAARPAPPPPA